MAEFREDIAQEYSETVEKMGDIVFEKGKGELEEFRDKLEGDIKDLESEIDEICKDEESTKDEVGDGVEA